MRDPELCCRRRLNEVLVPQQAFECVRFTRNEGAGHVVQEIQLLALEDREGPFGELQEEDDGDPLGGRTDRAPDHELEIDVAGNHNDGYKKGAQDGLGIEALLVLRRRLEKVPVLLDLLELIGLAPAEQIR